MGIRTRRAPCAMSTLPKGSQAVSSRGEAPPTNTRSVCRPASFHSTVWHGDAHCKHTATGQLWQSLQSQSPLQAVVLSRITFGEPGRVCTSEGGCRPGSPETSNPWRTRQGSRNIVFASKGHLTQLSASWDCLGQTMHGRLTCELAGSNCSEPLVRGGHDCFLKDRMPFRNKQRSSA